MIIVTGASRGIGLAIAERLATQGREVLGLARSVVVAATFEFRSADVTSDVTLRAVAKDLKADGRTPIALVNAAGIASMNLAMMTPASKVRAVVETNLLGTIYSCQAFAPLMVRGGQGSIINFSSIAVSLGLRGESVYAASKSGVETFSRVFAREVAGHGIRVNCVAPGPIATDLLKGVTSEQIDLITEQQVIQRQFTVSDVCDVVELLLDQRSASISGQVLHIGGV